MRTHITRVLLIAGLAAAAATAIAQPQQLPHEPTAAELLSMPDFCRAKFSSNQTLYQEWSQRLTPSIFMHMHHYCHGLKHMRRANTVVDRQQRTYNLQRAGAEFDYVIQRWPDSFDVKAVARKQQAMARQLLSMQ